MGCSCSGSTTSGGTLTFKSTAFGLPSGLGTTCGAVGALLITEHLTTGGGVRGGPTRTTSRSSVSTFLSSRIISLFFSTALGGAGGYSFRSA